MYGGIYRCTGIYFFKSAAGMDPCFNRYCSRLAQTVTDFADASHSKSAKSTTTTVLYGIFSSENSYPCTVTFNLPYYFSVYICEFISKHCPHFLTQFPFYGIITLWQQIICILSFISSIRIRNMQVFSRQHLSKRRNFYGFSDTDHR